jgi:hypothetical protein
MLNLTKTLRSLFQTCFNPSSLTNSPARAKRNAVDEEASIRRYNNQSNSQTTQTPAKKTAI